MYRRLEGQSHLRWGRLCIIVMFKFWVNYKSKSMSFYFMVRFQFKGVMKPFRCVHSTLRDNRPSLPHKMGWLVHDEIVYSIISRWIPINWRLEVLFQPLKIDLSPFSGFKGNRISNCSWGVKAACRRAYNPSMLKGGARKRSKASAVKQPLPSDKDL